MSFEYESMTDEQRSALKSLRRACIKAGKADLTGFGCSGSFFVYPGSWNVIENGHMNALPLECFIPDFDCDGGDT